MSIGPCDNRGITDPRPPRRLNLGLRLLLGVLGLLALLAHATHAEGRFTRGGLPHGDGLYHYAQVRSLVLDQDLRLANDYALLGNPHGQPTREDGWAGNHFTFGTALVWIPSFVLAHAAGGFGDAAGWWQDPGDGSSERVRRWTMFGSVVAGWLALLLMARTLLGWFGSRAVGLSVVLAAVATPFWWYLTRQPSWSHAASALAVAGLVHASAKGGPQRGAWRGFCVGLWLGLVVLVRPQDVVFASWPLWLGLAGLRDPRRRGSAAVGLVVMVAVAAALWLPQAWVWQQTYGDAWLVPQGPGFMRWAESRWDLVLWSSRGGLLPWSPAVGLALAGLGVAAWRGRAEGLARSLVVSLAAAVFVCGAVDDWWGGWAFGARRLVGCTVVFAFGWAALLDPVLDGRWRGKYGGRIVVAALAIASIRLSLQMQGDYLHGRVRRGVPQALAPAWSRAFGLPLDGVLEVTGNPGSWPASWVFAARSGARPGRYDLTAGWALVRARGDRKGYERLWMEDSRWALSGFGGVVERGGHRGREVEGRAAIGVPLRGGLGLEGRLRVWAEVPTTLRVEGWGEAYVVQLHAGWHDYALPSGRSMSGGVNILWLEVGGGRSVELAWLDLFLGGHDPT